MYVLGFSEYMCLHMVPWQLATYVDLGVWVTLSSFFFLGSSNMNDLRVLKDVVLDGVPGKIKQWVVMTDQDRADFFYECEYKAFKQAVIKMSEKKWTKLLESGKLDDCPEIRQIRERGMRKTGKQMWIAISPPFESKDLNELRKELVKQTEKYTSKKILERAAWCFEQTGDADNLGKHAHCHMLVEFKKVPYPSDFEKELKSCFKHLFQGVSLNDHNFHWRANDPSHESRRISYLRKRGREDTDSYKMNTKWRRLHSLPDVNFRGRFSEKNSEICPDSSDEESE